MGIDLKRMEQQLVLHEGLVLHFYPDTEGYITVGIGFNVSARGVDELARLLGRAINAAGDITRAEAFKLLRLDIERFNKVIPVHFPEYAKLDGVRQRVVLDMAFNMGFRALGFKNAIEAVKNCDWSRAARELYKSKWARQVGDGEGGKRDRCDRLAGMLLTGQEPTDIPAI